MPEKRDNPKNVIVSVPVMPANEDNRGLNEDNRDSNEDNRDSYVSVDDYWPDADGTVEEGEHTYEVIPEYINDESVHINLSGNKCYKFSSTDSK